MAEITGRLDDDELRVLGAEAPLRPLEVFVGDDGPDVFNGGGEADDATGGGGNDTLLGGGGNDVLRGNAGADTIRGGGGADRIEGGGGPDRLLGGGGRDTILGQAGQDVIDGGPGADTLNGGPGNDRITGRGGPDRINGQGGEDELAGNGGADEIAGGGGHDVLRGGSHDDTLAGGAGNDNLDGQHGTDVMTGGPGDDTFRFSVLDGAVDRVLDFVVGEDRLDLSPLIDPDDIPDSGNTSQFVRFQSVPGEGTVVSIDPAGGGDFEHLTGLEGTEVGALSLAELGLSGTAVSERTIVSATAGGVEGNGTSFAPALSEDGGFVTFSSSATNLDGGDATFDIFLKNLETGSVTRISESGGVGGNADSFFSSIDADGRTIAFDSFANNLPGDENFSTAQSDVFRAEVASGDIEFISIENNTFASAPSLSANGNRVAFEATATGRAETGDPAPAETIIPRVYVRLANGSLVEASSDDDGNFADEPSGTPDLAANGRFVAFESLATNLAGTDANAGSDIFVKDLTDGSVEVASTATNDAQIPGAQSSWASISANGRIVAFQSTGRFVAADTDTDLDIYVKNLNTGAIELASTSAGGANRVGDASTPSISDDGRYVAFRSAATNLVAGDANGVPDIFVKDLQTGALLRFPVQGDSSDANDFVARPALSGDGSVVAFVSDLEVNAAGGLDAGQVVAAPVEFDGAGPTALQIADVLEPGQVPVGGAAPTAIGPSAAGAPAMALDSMLAPDEIA